MARLRSSLPLILTLLSVPAAAGEVGAEGSFGEDFVPAPGDEFIVRNTSAAGIRIAEIRFDLNGSPDVVFDPLQDGGQPGELFDTVGSSGFSGDFEYTDSFFQPLPDPRDVFRQLRLTFTDFDPGEEVTVALDADDDLGVEAFVSPAAFAGSTITITFTDGQGVHVATDTFVVGGMLSTFDITEPAPGLCAATVPALGPLGVAVFAALLACGALRELRRARS